MDKLLKEQLENIVEFGPGMAIAGGAALGGAAGWVTARALTRLGCKRYFKNDPERYKRCMSYRSTPAGMAYGAIKGGGIKSIKKDWEEAKKDREWGKEQIRKEREKRKAEKAKKK